MKNFVMAILVKWFGVDFINGWIMALLDRSERTQDAMGYLLAEGMTQRTLPPHYIAFIKELQAGTKDKRVQKSVIYRDVLDNITPHESIQLAAHALLAPYTDSKEYPEQLLYRVRAEIAPFVINHVPMLGFVKILSDALVKELGVDVLPVEVARAVASIVFHTEKLYKGKAVK